MTSAAGATVLAAGRVSTPEQVLAPGWVAVERGRVVEVGSGSRRTEHDLGPVTITPGFVDLHCHGGGGSSFSEGPAAAETALLAHRRQGTTSVVASLATDTLESLAAQVRGLAPLVQTEQLVGVHLEGPWLSTLHPGVHQVSLMRDPEPTEVTG